MNIFHKIKKWQLITLLAIAVVPLVMTALELVFSKDSKTYFLGDFHPNASIILVVYYFLLIGLGIYWFVKQLITIFNLKKEQAIAELALLKSQVNPHFFFNILNNLYGLVATDQQKAKNVILKLSDVMRYSIYEGEKYSVSLEEEIAYLQNYVELHKMRYHKNIDVEFSIEGQMHYKIAPLLLIMLVENAFKHGVENLTKGAYVKMKVVTTEFQIKFTIQNNFEKSENSREGGIGLKNLKRRLELVYPNKHILLLSQIEPIYTAELTIEHL